MIKIMETAATIAFIINYIITLIIYVLIIFTPDIAKYRSVRILMLISLILLIISAYIID